MYVYMIHVTLPLKFLSQFFMGLMLPQVADKLIVTMLHILLVYFLIYLTHINETCVQQKIEVYVDLTESLQSTDTRKLSM